MRPCVRFAPMIGSRLDELSPGDAKFLASHLAECGACRAIAADHAATEGLVRESLLARSNARDFSRFVDEVMARVQGTARATILEGEEERRAPPRAGSRHGLWGFLERHRRAAAAALVPALAALAVIVYVHLDGGRDSIALLELSSEGEVTTVLKTADGPVLLFAGEGDAT